MATGGEARGRGRGRYALERALGRGGMATVFLARDTLLDRRVALKALAEGLASEAAARERFLREARFAARLVHPNVVQVYDAGEDETGPFIVMEYVEGDTLAAELAGRGRLPADEVVRLGLALCSALAAAHAAGLVHRDVKPQNVLLGRDGAVKLGDFGIARSREGTTLTERGSVVGTAAYLSPEQARGEPAGPAADLYALGVVLYQALTGRVPYEAASLPELVLRREREPVVPPRALVQAVPAALDAAVVRCLEPRPDDRPASAAALGRELAGGGAPVAAAEAPTTVLPRVRRFPRQLAIAAAALAAVAGFALVLVLRTDGGGEAAATTAATTTAPRRTTTTPRPTTTAPPTTTTSVAATPAPQPAQTPPPDPCARVDEAAQQLDARRHALDKQKKGAAKDRRHAVDEQKRALDEQKHALDRQRKACR